MSRLATGRSKVTKVEKLSLAEARRIALAAQGFGGPRPERVTAARWLKTVDQLSLHQIDSVNVLVRAHYLPAFSRLGPYDRSLIDTAAWGSRKKRRLFEYWAHEASLLPLPLHPLLRWRMARADRGEVGWKGLRVFAGERRAEAEAFLKRIRNEGPRAASDFEEKRTRSGWWEWGDAKRALEWLFWAGHITTATRRGSFERVYDLTERIIPAEILALPTPDEKEAQRALIERFEDQYNVEVIHAWGMTETSPIGSMSSIKPPLDRLPPAKLSLAARTWMGVLRLYLMLAGGLVLFRIVMLAFGRS